MTSSSKAGPAGSPVADPQQRRGLYVVLALLFAEITLTGPIYEGLVTFNCWNNWPRSICSGFNMAMIGVYTTVAGLGLLAMLLPVERRALFKDAAPRRGPLILNLLGVAVFFFPALLFQEGSGTRNMAVIILAWGAGVALGASGALLMLAPAARWAGFVRARRGVLAACVIAGLSAPYLALTVLPLWRISVLSDATFHSVIWLMTVLGFGVTANYDERSIGDEVFRANIAPLCSGVEGVALIVFFVTMYLALFRRELRFPAAFVLYPFGILASWLLNIVRIAVLIAIGMGGHPDLAVNGFHSHAGWLMFTLLSLGIVGLARSTGFFAAKVVGTRPAAAVVPLLADPVVAQILPFAIFMASALLASTFATMPTLVYPLRAAAMAAGLAMFLPWLRGLGWRLDPLALGVGLAIGVVWAATAPPAAGSDLVLAGALQDLAGPGFVVWVVARVIGTTVLVPIIEELFFRGYLLQRLMGEDRLIWRVGVGVALTAALFGALHDRWILAAVAGVAYAALRLRSGRITDAILAHAASNAWIAGAAILANDWSLI